MLDHESVRRLRAHAQALAGGAREDSAEAVVQRVFAIQAQDATASDLGIRVRGRDITTQAIRTAYEKERSIVRGWYMRGTLHTIPSDDARWVLPLLSPRILAATNRRYQQLGLDDDLRQRADHLIRRALASHGPLTRAELTEHLTTLGIPPDGQAPFHLIRHAALTGILCHGPQRTGEATYVLLNDWLPTTGRFRWEGDAVLAELARRYLAAYAPATLEDFAAWSGLPVTWARRAWKMLAESGAITEYGTLTMLAGRVKELPGSSDTPDVRMLPAYDNYLIGYRTREVSVPALHQARVWPGGGLIRPTVVADGLAIATWTRGSGSRSIQVDAFEPVRPQIEQGIDMEKEAVVGFLRPTS
ncbi:winged helix DNA-binding domain-containing protein [Streptomyces hirsutus]|uniref:Winged helix DNA-binding domain-containing protein n=1 Tax=Streptomyces hirsutus TaxID=35620 RepID=A0ABZ1GGS9_9ACTN|nr:winged helix DNA-binding domain-containing protein [Streptomyces hirsutus]WSD04841.1 winged helix DNA-binding domain-containing protein [Streptomyces hirsutus]WTD21766.1 winged helix DNA-binding domain-containing protein [Streptomyces hirsutus]